MLTLSDIAEAKERERELVYSRRLAEAVLQAAAQPLALIGDDLKLRALNSAFAALLGLRGEDGVGRRFDEVAPGKWDAEGLRELQVKRARGRAPLALPLAGAAGDGGTPQRLTAHRLDIVGDEVILLSIDPG